MSALGHKRTLRAVNDDVSFTSRAGIRRSKTNVRLGPIVLKKSAVATHEVH
jgi:hypothetical protein